MCRAHVVVFLLSLNPAVSQEKQLCFLSLMSPVASPSFLFVSSCLPCFSEDSQKGETYRLPFLDLPPVHLSKHPTWFPFLLLFLFYLCAWILSDIPFSFSPLQSRPTSLRPAVHLHASPPRLTPLFLLAFPSRWFPNSWSPSGATWRGPSLCSLPSHQEPRLDSKLWFLSTTTTRRPTSCWPAAGLRLLTLPLT